MANTLSLTAAEWMREQLSEPDFMEKFVDSLKRDAIKGDRTSRNIVARTLGVLGLQEDLAREMLKALGVSLQVAKQAVAVHASAQPLVQDRVAMIEQAERYLVDVYREDPAASARSPLRGVLGLKVEVEGSAGQ